MIFETPKVGMTGVITYANEYPITVTRVGPGWVEIDFGKGKNRGHIFYETEWNERRFHFQLGNPHDLEEVQ